MTVIVIGSLFWVAYLFRFNLGSLINKIWGKKETAATPKITDQDDNVVGISVGIIKSKDPFRDKNLLVLENGDKLELPKGIVDSDVEKVILESPGVYDVKIKHNRITVIFNS